jgi:hypothetical protein
VRTCLTVGSREGRSSTVAARMARQRGNGGGRKGEQHSGFTGEASGDAAVTTKMPLLHGHLDRCTYGGVLPTDQWSAARTGRYGTVHGMRAAGRIPRPRSMLHGEGARPGTAGCLGRRGLERGCRGGRRAACATSRRDGALTEFVLLSTCLKANNSKFLNRTTPNFEYESCRSSYPLPLSKSLYSIFLNRFCREGLPTLNATQMP